MGMIEFFKSMCTLIFVIAVLNLVYYAGIVYEWFKDVTYDDDSDFVDISKYLDEEWEEHIYVGND